MWFKHFFTARKGVYQLWSLFETQGVSIVQIKLYWMYLGGYDTTYRDNKTPVKGNRFWGQKLIFEKHICQLSDALVSVAVVY